MLNANTRKVENEPRTFEGGERGGGKEKLSVNNKQHHNGAGGKGIYIYKFCSEEIGALPLLKTYIVSNLGILGAMIRFHLAI